MNLPIISISVIITIIIVLGVMYFVLDTDSNTEMTTAPITSSEPTTSEPITSEPTTSEPITSEPTTSEPTTSEPTTERTLTTTTLVPSTTPCPQYFNLEQSKNECQLNLSLLGNLVGHYTADSIDISKKKWNDLSSKKNNATLDFVSGFSKQGNLILGRTWGKVYFPSTILPKTYTLFAVSKYQVNSEKPSRNRIITGNPNFVFGHYGGKSGVAFANGKWLTPQTSLHGDNLVISSGTKSLYRSNGVQRSTITTGGTSNIAINTWPGNQSDWAIGEIIVYDEELDGTKIQIIEDYLSKKYGVNLGN